MSFRRLLRKATDVAYRVQNLPIEQPRWGATVAEPPHLRDRTDRNMVQSILNGVAQECTAGIVSVSYMMIAGFTADLCDHVYGEMNPPIREAIDEAAGTGCSLGLVESTHETQRQGESNKYFRVAHHLLRAANLKDQQPADVAAVRIRL